MNIVIFDNDNFDRAKALARALDSPDATVRVWHCNHYYDHNGKALDQSAVSGDVVVLFYHRRNFEALKTSGISATCQISYSAESGIADIPQAISGDGFTVREAQYISEQIKASNPASLKERILECWRDNTSLFALRLLCEAWILNEGVGACEKAGIIINAPVKPEDWFRPFQKAPTPDAATEIAEQMGSAQDASELFLQRVAGFAAAGEDMTGAGFQKSIQDLKAALDNAMP